MHLWDRVNAATGQPVPAKASIIVLSVIFASVVIAFSGSFTQGLDFTYFEPLLSPVRWAFPALDVVIFRVFEDQHMIMYRMVPA